MNATTSFARRAFRFTGQQYLGGLNLYYYKARFYSPALGRFLQTDPIGYASDLNLYTHVGNNPVNWFDPSGQYAEVVVNGRQVIITLPILYIGEGVRPSVTGKFNSAISSNWSGTFGDYSVTVKVTSPPSGTPEHQMNVISVPRGNDFAYVNGTGGRTGTWPADRPGWTGAHEAGHLMGSDDHYASGVATPGWKGNIMAEQGGRVDSRNISEILNWHALGGQSNGASRREPGSDKGNRGERK